MDLKELRVFVEEWLQTLSASSAIDCDALQQIIFSEQEGLLAFAQKKYDEGYMNMLDVAKKYYTLLEQGKSADPEEKHRLKMELDKLSAPYSENIAYHAFLEMERLAAGII